MRTTALRTVWLSLLLAAAPIVGCTDSRATDQGDADWGPLTVVDADVSGGGEARIGEGPLRIDDCVTIDIGPREVLLVWKADQTAWDADRALIRFTNIDGSELELRDGQVVVAGGGGVGAEGAALPDNLVAEPAPSCPADAGLVTSIEIAPG